VCVSRVLLVVMCAERLCVQVWCVQSGYVCRVVMCAEWLCGGGKVQSVNDVRRMCVFGSAGDVCRWLCERGVVRVQWSGLQGPAHTHTHILQARSCILWEVAGGLHAVSGTVVYFCRQLCVQVEVLGGCV